MGTSLANQVRKDSFKDVLQVSNSNSGVDTTLRPISDGEGNDSALNISTNKASVVPAADATDTFEVKRANGTSLLKVDTTNSKVVLGNVECETINGIILDYGTTVGRPLLGASDKCIYYDTDLALWIFWNGATLSWV